MKIKRPLPLCPGLVWHWKVIVAESQELCEQRYSRDLALKLKRMVMYVSKVRTKSTSIWRGRMIGHSPQTPAGLFSEDLL